MEISRAPCAGKRGIKRRSRSMTGQSIARTAGRRKSHRCQCGKEGDQKKESTDGGPIQCLNCRKKGHLSKLRNKDKAHVARSEEEESALFMVSASVLSDVPNFDSKFMEVEIIDDGVEPEEEL